MRKVENGGELVEGREKKKGRQKRKIMTERMASKIVNSQLPELV